MKIRWIFVGISLLIAALLLAFGIILSSLKEGDHEGFYGLIISGGFVCLGIF